MNGRVAAEECRSSVTAAPPRQSVARSFAAAASAYDSHAALQRRVADRLLSALPAGAPQQVLDIGSGTGYCTAALHARWPQTSLLALDIAAPMLQCTRARVPTVLAVCADAEALPFAAASLDLVVSSLAMQWCGDVARFFRELARVTRPGGCVLLSTFGPATLHEVRRAWAEVDAYTHVNDFTAAELLQQQAAVAGFSCVLQRELLHEQVPSLQALARTLKGIGAHHVNRTQAQGLTSPRKFRRAADCFAANADTQGLIPVTWELFYLTLERLHEPSTP